MAEQNAAQIFLPDQRDQAVKTQRYKKDKSKNFRRMDERMHQQLPPAGSAGKLVVAASQLVSFFGVIIKARFD